MTTPSQTGSKRKLVIVGLIAAFGILLILCMPIIQFIGIGMYDHYASKFCLAYSSPDSQLKLPTDIDLGEPIVYVDHDSTTRVYSVVLPFQQRSFNNFAYEEYLYSQCFYPYREWFPMPTGDGEFKGITYIFNRYDNAKVYLDLWENKEYTQRKIKLSITEPK